MIKRVSLFCAVFSACFSSGQESNGEITTTDSQIEEVVVTARKRSESMLDVPIAISVVQEHAIEERGVTEFNQLEKYLPNTVQTNFGQGNTNHAVIFMRGTGLQDHIITTDPAVGIYLDGVYLGRTVGANFDLLGIERIEFARGPQGSLSGRNTLGGAVHVVTRRPTGDGARKLNIRIGSLGRLNVGALMDVAVSPTNSLAASFGYKSREGVGTALRIEYPDAEVGEINQRFGRLSWYWSPTDSVSAWIRADFSQAQQGVAPHQVVVNQEPNDLGLRQRDQPLDPDDTNSVNNELMSTDDRSRGIAVIVDSALSDVWNMKTLLSYRDMWFDAGLDNEKIEPSLLEFPEVGESDQISLEFQLNRHGRKIDWVGGIYVFREKGYNDSPFIFRTLDAAGEDLVVPTNDFDGLLYIEQESSSRALFSHSTVKLGESWDLGFGLRYTIDEKDAGAFLHYFPSKVDRSETWSEVTGDISITRRLSRKSRFYGLYARGYQAGGYPPRPFSGPSVFTSFDPTFADSFEIGLKYKQNANMQLNVAVFHVNYTDLSVQVSELIDDGFLTLTRNAAESTATGLELEGRFRWNERFGLDYAIGFIDVRVTGVDSGVSDIEVGDKPALTPDTTLTLSPSLTFPLVEGSRIQGRLDWYYRSAMFGEPTNTMNNRIPSLSMTHLQLLYHSKSDRWKVGIYAQNLTDEVYALAKLDLSPMSLIINSNDRREIGLRLSIAFD